MEQIDETTWTTLQDYSPTSIAQIAETTLPSVTAQTRCVASAQVTEHSHGATR